MARIERHDLTRKEMKGPDWFLAKASQALEWTGRKQKRILGLAVAALAIFAGGVGISAWLDHREAAAGALLSRTLEALEGEVSAAALPPMGRHVFPTAAERDRAILSAAAEVLREHPSSQAARTAAIAAGAAHLRLGEWDAALARFDSYLGGARAGDSLRFAALEGAARAREGKGEIEQALRAYERLGAEEPAYKDWAALERARLLARMGQVDEARAILQGFVTEYRDSPLQAEAQERLRRLGGA